MILTVCVAIFVEFVFSQMYAKDNSQLRDRDVDKSEFKCLQSRKHVLISDENF